MLFPVLPKFKTTRIYFHRSTPITAADQWVNECAWFIVPLNDQRSFRRLDFPGNWLHWYWQSNTRKQKDHIHPKHKINKKLCYCRETARRATSVEIVWPLLTELLIWSYANPEEPCEHTVSWNRVKCCTNVRRIACENVCNRWMTFSVIQGHCCCHHLMDYILFHISLPL